MKIVSIILYLITLPFLQAGGQSKNVITNYPSKVLTNDCLKVTVLLPNHENGYYRSTRFDWSGIIAQVEYGNHTFFQDWKDYNGTINPGKHDPLNAGTGTGTVEEFRDPLGYNEANIGDNFLKIGVGILERAEDKPYHWSYPYKIIEPGTWKVFIKKNSIDFTQEIETDFGYAYFYKKTILLEKDKAEIKIIHTLKNTGKKEIHANPYCHNFFRFDNQFIGKEYEIEFPKPIHPIDEFDSRVKIQKNYFQLYPDLLDDNWTGGHIDPAGAKRFILSNKNTRTSVEVISDIDTGPFYICAWKLAFCPEPMIEFYLQPDEVFTWTRIYKFNN